MIEAQNLTKRYLDRKGREICAVSEVSFQCRAGQIYGLLGMNGAGKTTTLRMLATILQPTEGTARVAGFDLIKEPQQVRASIGFLSASTAVNGRLNPIEIVRYFGQLSGVFGEVLEQRREQLFKLLDIDKFAQMRLDKLSTGMRQKVAIACTIVHDPSVIIFDEPTLGLDVLAARAVVRFVAECKTRGKTVLFSSHIMSEVEKLCDVIGIIHQGKLLAEGTPRELCERTGAANFEDSFISLIEEAKCN